MDTRRGHYKPICDQDWIRINGVSKYSKDDKLTSDLLGRQVIASGYRILLETIHLVLEVGHFVVPNNP
jgi:hypothetical protein